MKVKFTVNTKLKLSQKLSKMTIIPKKLIILPKIIYFLMKLNDQIYLQHFQINE